MPKSKALPYFSRRMRELRLARGLSLYRLSKETGVSDQALGKLERGSAPSLDTAARIARALAVPVAELIEPDGASRVTAGG